MEIGADEIVAIALGVVVPVLLMVRLLWEGLRHHDAMNALREYERYRDEW